MSKERKYYVSLIDEMYKSIASKIQDNWGFNPWPIIRIQTGYFFFLVFNGSIGTTDNLKKKKTEQPKKNIKAYASLVKRFLKIYYTLWQQKTNVKNSILLVGYDKHRVIKDNNRVSTYLDPFKFYLDEMGIKNNIMLIDAYDGNQTKLNKLFNECYQYSKLKFELFNDKSEILILHENVQIVQEFLETTVEGQYAEFIATNIYNTITAQAILYEAFIVFLKKTIPKAIWTYCYYDNTVMSLTRAANQLGIDTLEYQHGTQSDDHFAYAPWQDVDNYSKLFPCKFWTWRYSDQIRAINNFAGNTYKPHVILGGNPFLANEIQSLRKKEYLDANKSKGVLITLQGSWIPDFMQVFIENNKYFKWYFRLHPRYPEDKVKLEKLYNSYPEKIDIEQSNTLSLYKLFSMVSYHITVSSSTALEAQAFGLVNIIFNEDGLSTYKNYIDRGAFEYVINEETFRKALRKNLNTIEQFDPIITNVNQIKSTIKYTANAEAIKKD